MGSFRISRTLRRCLQKKRNRDPMPRRKKNRWKDRWALFGFRGLSDVAFKKRGTEIQCHGEKRTDGRTDGLFSDFEDSPTLPSKKEEQRSNATEKKEQMEGQMGSFRISRTLRRCLQKKRNRDPMPR